jgi:hypothetical protein
LVPSNRAAGAVAVPVLWSRSPLTFALDFFRSGF